VAATSIAPRWRPSLAADVSRGTCGDAITAVAALDGDALRVPDATPWLRFNLLIRSPILARQRRDRGVRSAGAVSAGRLGATEWSREEGAESEPAGRSAEASVGREVGGPPSAR
jgi:hypothetical protein